jgi:hypothetical protein
MKYPEKRESTPLRGKAAQRVLRAVNSGGYVSNGGTKALAKMIAARKDAAKGQVQRG